MRISTVDIACAEVYSLQPKVSIRVDVATELSVRGSHSASELMAGNSREPEAAASD